VPYCFDPDHDLIDVYEPAVPIRRPAPLVVYVHGGGWTAGSRQQALVELGGVAQALLARGFVVASVDYRLAPVYRWPAQVEDVKCAVRYLRAAAAQFGIDPARVGAIGDSAGGHLAALLGLAGPVAGWDVGPFHDQSSQVQAVVDLFGPADLTAADWRGASIDLGPSVFGYRRGQAADVLRRASPVWYIGHGGPPFLIIQGDKDRTVPPSQSRELYSRLVAAGAPVRLVPVAGAGHEFVPAPGPVRPSLLDLKLQVVAFFANYLGA